MYQLPFSIIITVAVLTVFLAFIVVLKFAVENEFIRMRLMMTSFFFFIIATLTISFWQFFFATLPYTIPAGLVGVILGYIVAVPAAQERLKKEGFARYSHDFAQIEVRGIKGFPWWSVINFYTIMASLLLINFVGLTTVLLHNLMPMALTTSAFGALLIGTLIPYLWHLWTIKRGVAKGR